MPDVPLNEQRVLAALDDFTDPETGRSIVRLEQIRGVKVHDSSVEIALGLTTFSAPLWKEIQADLVEHLRSRLPEIAHAQVTIELHERPAEKMGEIGLSAKSVIAVGSGKGGVGKSTIAAILAYGLRRAGC